MMNRMIAGALAGLTATAPMTLAMKAMHKSLPPNEQYPLAPSLITEKVAEEAGVAEQMDEKEHKRLTWLAHYAFGAASGALYAPLASKLRTPPIVTGVLYGLTVWGGSYLGLLPAAGILRPVTEHPPRRTALMIAAHVVWGAVTGAIVGRIGNSRRR
jgi:uncharacterized membrane protein YagU involved in acid resistance